MKLTGKLKEQVENAKSTEEAKKILEEVGVKLTDEEMALVTGGNMQVGKHIDWN